MSLVGPRPLLMKYLPFYTEQERIRFTVRPGITGWAQINGRNYSRWDDRLRNDIFYVQNWCLFFDVRILLRTAIQVFYRRDIAVDANSVLPDLSEERALLEAYHSR